MGEGVVQMMSNFQFGVIVGLLLFIIYGGYLNNRLAAKAGGLR